MDEFERTIDELESLFVDPQFASTMNEVGDINKIIKDQPISENEAVHIVTSLNEQWRQNGFYNRELFVSGAMYIGGEVATIEYRDDSQSELSQFKGQPIRSKGFSMEVASSLENGVFSYQQQIVMRGRTEVEDTSGVGGISNEVCTIPLVPEALIECREITPHKVAAWLDIYYGDTKRLIDECILQADNEADAVMNLRDTPLSPPEGSKKDIRELQQHLNNYIAEYVQFDQYIPYRAVLFGPLKVFNTDTKSWDDKEAMSEGKTLLNIKNASVNIHKKKREFEIYIQANIIERSKTHVTTVIVPVGTIESLESGREILRSASS